MSVVKINHSPSNFVSEQWKEVLQMFRLELQYYKSFSTTLQSKAIISKSILLSKLNYMCNVHVMPDYFRKSIDKMLINFYVPRNWGSKSDLVIERNLIEIAAPKFLVVFLLIMYLCIMTCNCDSAKL